MGVVWRLRWPLLASAFVAVVLNALAVAWLGVHAAGLPLLAAVALGAIVAPPDAVAATAILIFTTAVALQTRGGIDAGLSLQLGLAVPGGVLLGMGLAKVLQYLRPFFDRMVSGYLLEYLFSFGAWIIAEHLHLFAVLCVVAFAMTLARSASRRTPPRMRLHNTAVSHTTVFDLNVLAFLLMGLQAKAIVACLTLVRMAWR